MSTALDARMFDVTDMQPMKAYPPEVQQVREAMLDVLDDMTRRLVKTADEQLKGLPPELQSRKRRELQAAYLRETAPITADLVRLEMFALISFVASPKGDT